MTQQMFGGDWTEEKLERVRKYLNAYITLMKGNPRGRYFRVAYIDAFAGTGYRNLREVRNPQQIQLPELTEADSVRFLDGSARIALRVEPAYDKYIFIEQDAARADELKRLQAEFPNRDIEIREEDANQFLIRLCQLNWKNNRAVLFLDPFGMEVAWTTIQAIANTEAIDLWYLFPLVAVNRMLRRDGKIDEGWIIRLDALFGERNWRDVFYKTETVNSLFGQEERTTKVADFQVISDYFVERLKTAFQAVAPNPLVLRNSKNSPLFLLCFAAANKKGGPTAIRIAQDILRS